MPRGRKKTDKTRKQIEDKYKGLPDTIQDYFSDFKKLFNDKHSSDIIVAYLFMEVERAQYNILYGAMVKKHKIDKDYARNALDDLRIQRFEFRELYEILAKKEIIYDTIKHADKAHEIRNKVIHGREISENAKKVAIIAILEYAHLLNNDVYADFQFKPFGSRKGFKGRGKSHSPALSGWVLEGLLSRLENLDKKIKKIIVKRHDKEPVTEPDVQPAPANPQAQEPPNAQ